MKIELKRIYEKPSPDDGYRILIDRLWPRGVSGENARIDEWLKEIAPGDELRKWFHHDPNKWNEFKERYGKDLEEHPDIVERICRMANRQRITLVYAAKDKNFNNAVALREYLEKRMKSGGR